MYKMQNSPQYIDVIVCPLNHSGVDWHNRDKHRGNDEIWVWIHSHKSYQHDTLSGVIRCGPVFNELNTVNTQKQLANNILYHLLCCI